MQEIVQNVSLADIGLIANTVARKHILSDYQQMKAAETLRRQSSDIKLFERYLTQAHHFTEGMKDDLSLWSGMSYGIVSGFQRWLLQQGYSIGSINVCMATIKTYCDLANQAGYIIGDEMAMIRGLKGYNRKAGRNVNEKRSVQRIGKKKGQPVLLSDAHVDMLKRKLRDANQDDVKAARDYLIFCFLVDHGLRCGEVVALETRNLDVSTGMLVFYRHKVDKVQTHKLTGDSLEAAHHYLKGIQPGQKLFQGYAYRDKKSAADGLTSRAINKIVTRFGLLIGVEGLSPHDLRHYWATRAVRKGTDIKSLQQAGGWNSPYMPLQYAAESEIANEGVKLV